MDDIDQQKNNCRFKEKLTLVKKYPWLRIVTGEADYIKPDYYDKLLKEYAFFGKTDLDIFSEFLKEVKINSNSSILELGCGTGRATKVIINNLEMSRLSVVDLSMYMVNACKKRFSKYRNIDYIHSDSLDYLKKTSKIYDLVFSLWSYSHSVYQLIERKGIRKGIKETEEIIDKFFKKNMRKDSMFFLIHSDWLSDEQKILIKQWGRDNDLYKEGKQGPSKLLLDRKLKELAKNRLIKFKIEHHIGDPIKYNSLDEALEIFINFHLESYFNKKDNIKNVIDDMEKYLKKFEIPDGKIYIRPNCFVYKCVKLK